MSKKYVGTNAVPGRLDAAMFKALFVIAACSAWVPSTLYAAAPSSLETDSEVDLLLTRAAGDVVGRLTLLEGQARSRNVSASLDLSRNAILLQLDREFLPSDYGPSFEDQRSLINNALLLVAEKFMHVPEVIHLYGGFDVYHYFPEIRAEDDAAREAGERMRREKQRLGKDGEKESGVAFVAAGHGYYLDHRDGVWKTQRGEHNGVQEGMLTPFYAAELKDVLERRSMVPVIRPRVQGGVATHPESGQAWWRMAARYSIQMQYPDNREIWNTHAGSAAKDREYREDINSRPLLANHVGADVAIHLHSNADDTGAARGARVIVQPGRAVDAALGSTVLCAMKEQIQSVPDYASFVVAPAPHVEDKGENRLATMPSIIVETAFHTHVNDAAALLDPVFRAAAMKGVEKGYRLFRDDKACTAFALHPIPDISLPAGTSQEISLPFEGHPQFPVTMEFTTANCSRPGACTPSKTTFADPAVPVTVRMRCAGNLTGEARWSVVLRDADGVATAPVEFQHTCFKPAA